MERWSRLTPWMLALVCALLSTPAKADSWPPPMHEIYTSANGRARVHIWPRELKNAIAYYSDQKESVKKPGQALGLDKAQVPIAIVEKKDAAGQWQFAWSRQLLNDIGPAAAKISNDGRYVVTFDNWYRAGYGGNVIVIYRADGTSRQYSLADFLPDYYRNALPRSISSRGWQCDATIEPDDRHLAIDFLIPRGIPTEPDEGCVRIRVSLADGVIIPPQQDIWEAAAGRAMTGYLAHIAYLNSEILRFHTDIAKPTDDDSYRQYLDELHWRLTSATLDDFAAEIIYDPKISNELCANLQSIDSTDGVVFFVSIGSDADMTSAIERCSFRASSGKLNNMELYFVISPLDDKPILAALAASGVSRANGAEINFVDATYPIRQRPDRLITPEQMTEYFSDPID